VTLNDLEGHFQLFETSVNQISWKRSIWLLLHDY